MKTQERIIWSGLIVAALAAAYFMPAAVLDADLCLFRRITSLECPFCGMTRSVHLAVHGEISAAAAHNPMGVALVIALAAALPFIWRGGIGGAAARFGAAFLAGGLLAGWFLKLIFA